MHIYTHVYTENINPYYTSIYHTLLLAKGFYVSVWCDLYVDIKYTMAEISKLS